VTRPEEWADHLDPSVEDPQLSDAERADLDRIAESLADEDIWTGPPPHLRAALLAQVAAEAAAGGPAAVTSPATVSRLPSPGERRTTAHRTRPGRRAAWYLAAAGVAASLATVAVLARPQPQTTTFALAGAGATSAATATVALQDKPAGVAVTLTIKGLKAAPKGSYYAAWMRGPAGTVPVGSFHWHKGGSPVDLWSGVPAQKYPELFVTLQREGQQATPSTDVVLQGHLSQ
jgi:hypothetical protein